MEKNDFAGTGTLFRLFLRRDRILLPIWVFLPALLAMSTASSAMAYQNLQEFISELTSNPLISSILGPIMSSNVAGVVVWRTTGQIVLILGIASLLTVIRHTRTEEETGRSELIRAYVTGRHAALTASLILTCTANLIAGFLVAFGLMGAGQPAGGAILFGLTIAAAGIFFSGVGALSAQLRENAGSAKGIGFVAIGVGILLLILNNGNGGYTGWSWIAPMAWHRLTLPFAGNHGWVLFYFVFLSAIPTAAAYYLSTRRDLSAGILPERPGPAQASPGLRSSLALAWQLHKGAVIGWSAGITAFGAAIGAIVQSVSETQGIGDLLGSLGGLDWMERVGNRNAFMGIMIYILALAVALYTMTAVLRLYKEETESKAEMVLAKPVSRARWMASHLIMAFVSSGALMLALGLAAGSIYGFTTGDVGSILTHVLIMCLSKIPAIWIMAGITALLYGLLPEIVNGVSWGFWAVFALIEFAWEGQIVDWSVMQMSPFAYAHYTIPITELSAPALLGQLCLVAALTGIGLFGFKRRNLRSKI